MKEISNKAERKYANLFGNAVRNIESNKFEGAAEGNWTFASYGLCDYSMNCLKDMSAYADRYFSEIDSFEKHGAISSEKAATWRIAADVMKRTLAEWIEIKKH